MSTITLPSGVEIEAGRVIIIPGIGTLMPSGDLTPTEVQALRDDVATVMNMGSGDLNDVDLTGINTGKILQRQSGMWVPVDPVTGVDSVSSQLGDTVTTVTSMYFRSGLKTVTGVGTGAITVEPVLGASGTTTALARADHFHPPTLKGRNTFDKAGAVLSTGVNMLLDISVTGLVATAQYDVDITGKVEGVNTLSSGRLRLYTQIGAYASQNISRGFSGGVWTEVSTDGVQMFVTGVTSLQLQFWAEYQSGDPTALYTGSLVYRMDPRGGTT